MLHNTSQYQQQQQSQGAITDAFHECFATVGWAKGKASSL